MSTHTKKSKKSGSCCTYTINQCDVNKANGNFILDKPGNYNLTSDIKGTLTITSDSVSLNLCNHTVDANNGSYAINVNVSLNNNNN